MSVCANYRGASPSSAIVAGCGTSSSFDLLFCMFFGLQYGRSSSTGGAVMISGTNTTTYIEKCFFYACSASVGGAIYISSPIFASIYSSCFYDCYASSQAQVFSAVPSSYSNLSVDFCSSAFCSRNGTAPYVVFEMDYGADKFTRNNVTGSNMLYNDGVRVYSAVRLDSSFCTFESNKLNFTYSLGSAVTVLISYVNFINNSGSVGLFYNGFSGTGQCSYSVFINDSFPSLNYASIITIVECAFSQCSFTATGQTTSMPVIGMPLLSSWMCPGNFTGSRSFTPQQPVIYIKCAILFLAIALEAV